MNVSVVGTVPKPLQNTGPAKPARTYKAVTRSKSFNVHGLNGTNDPSPIYIEKVGRFNNLGYNNHNSSMYRSTSHLNDNATQLKSPSIVNLISRSTRDLSSIHRDEHDGYTPRNYSNGYTNGGSNDVKKTILLKSVHERTPELYRPIIHEDPRNGKLYSTRYAREHDSSFGSRSPVTLNKDTAAIVRRGSSSTEDYSETFKSTSRSDDPNRPGVTNTVETVSRKTVPSADGRGQTRIESREVKSVTTGQYRGNASPINASPIRYIEDRHRRGSSNNGVTIELKHNRY